eukprot:11271514-Karenia_brevis.AAC.1
MQFNRAIRQGGVESPWLFNLVLRMILYKCVLRWREAGYGVPLPNIGKFNHAAWADNIYLVAHSLHEIRCMFADLTCEMRAYGFHWNERSLKLLHTSAHQPHEDINVQVNNVSHTLKTVMEMEVLGCLIAPFASNVAAAEHRLEKATASFWALSSFLLCRQIHIQRRLTEFYKR